MDENREMPDDEEIARMLSEWKEFTEAPPKGAPRKALTFIVLWVLLVALASVLYLKFNPMLVELWGTPDHPYLLRYRRFASKVWAASGFVAAHWWLLIPIAGLGLLVWPIQKRLTRPGAGLLLMLLNVGTFVLALCFVVWYFSFLIGPIIGTR